MPSSSPPPQLQPPASSVHPVDAPASLQVHTSDGNSSGQVIEYIEDRIFLASYDHEPSEHTPFPFAPSHLRPKSEKRHAADKRSSRSHAPISIPPDAPRKLDPYYVTMDYDLLYNAFHADFGPLHIGHLYRFSCHIHRILEHTREPGNAIVLWSHKDSRSRANAACLLACYMILIQHWPPHLALAPIAQIDPPLMPFRDAGYAQADFTLSIQDVVYGVWRAKEERLFDFHNFNISEYEKFERVDMGDFNWITPYFVAFASPQHMPVDVIKPPNPEYAKLPRSTAEALGSKLPQPFKMVLAHFRSKRVGLVVRLNSELYSSSYFHSMGMQHWDLIFEDGTCPPLSIVKRFIRVSHDMIVTKKRPIAIHCKAGLGRTGCLIGAYLIYRHGFTANEVIAFMRVMRPGMVVGPQQHWLHLNQGTFRQWWFEDSIQDKLALLKQSTPPRASTQRAQQVASNGQTATPPNGNVSSQKRRALGELSYNEQDTSMSSAVDENLPAPTPGQPRKTSKLYGERRSPYQDTENENAQLQPDVQGLAGERQMPLQAESESDEEYQLRLLAGKATRTPSGAHKRAISCLQTTTRTEWSYSSGGDENVSFEQGVQDKFKTPSPLRTQSHQGLGMSGSGAGTLAIGKRGSPVRRGASDRSGSGGVRKNSGRVGSAGAAGHASRVKQ